MSASNDTRFSTGNELIAIPDISAARCGVETISFLHRGLRATVELGGSADAPFLQPDVTIEGAAPDWRKAEWRLDENWVPAFELTHPDYVIRGCVFAPLQSRGFVYTLEIESKTDRELPIRAGWRSVWDTTFHATYTSKAMTGVRRVAINQWLGIPYVEFQSVAPHFAVAFQPSDLMEVRVFAGEVDASESVSEDGLLARPGMKAGCLLAREFTVGPNDRVSTAMYVGVGLEEISAVSSAADLSRRGCEELLRTTLAWLRRRSLRVKDRELEAVMNRNLFYNYFFGQGVTLDTEELSLVTSRSSRYPLTAAYCDRDAMLWSLPAVLRVEPRQARRMLEHAFTVQIRNVGIHSRFIDGIVLEPGFELDELCAPVHALWRYVHETNDLSMLFDRRVQAGINHIQDILSRKKHPTVSLYETTLLPSDDVAVYPYVTFDNAMVWRMLRDLGRIYDRIGDLDRKDDTIEQAKRVKQAVMEHALVKGPFGQMFAWSVDLKGNHRLLDNPQGSLQLLPHIEFCSPDLDQYQNTVRWIRSEENPANAPHGGRKRVSLFSIANELLMGSTRDALEFLRRAPLDHGLCCEIADAETGEAVSGRGYAACAGYLAYAMAVALGVEPLELEEAATGGTPHFRLDGAKPL
ncbi:MAG: glycoside hydrolase family 125 protein [Armatimonadota bacterium]|nr:glycoside hydrolase family 125 protein [Armatimonadota bacterium]